jgi:nucleotide-binding universal stress UspA family protein
MLSKGSSPFKKILVPVSGSFSGYRALEIATEIAIQSKAKLDAVFVSQNGNTGKIEDLKDKIRKFSSLYGIEIELKLLKGNVITEVSRISKYYNLLIIGGRKNVKNNWFTPYPPYYLLHKSKCTSLLICTEK